MKKIFYITAFCLLSATAAFGQSVSADFEEPLLQEEIVFEDDIVTVPAENDVPALSETEAEEIPASVNNPVVIDDSLIDETPVEDNSVVTIENPVIIEDTPVISEETAATSEEIIVPSVEEVTVEVPATKPVEEKTSGITIVTADPSLNRVEEPAEKVAETEEEFDSSLYDIPAKSVLESIEDLKSYVEKHPEEKATVKSDLNLLYNILEKRTYTASSKNGDLIFDVKDYDTENQCWPVEIKFSFEGTGELWSTTCTLLYSDVLVKTFISDKQMTERQLNEYQFNVNYYDQLIRENQILNAELTYQIKAWKAAGEYRFEPLDLKIFKLEKTTQQIYQSEEMSLENVFFYVIPAIEIREEDEIRADAEKIDLIIAAEESQKQLLNKSDSTEAPKPADNNKKKKPMQRKRNSIYFSGALERSDFNFNLYYKNISLLTAVDEVQADFTLGLCKFVYMGVTGGYDLSSINSTPVYNAGLDLGFNFMMGHVIRPYVQGTLLYTSDNNAMAKAGGGFDFVMGVFMLNTACTYNWKFDVQSVLNKSSTITDMFTSSKPSIGVSVGLGFTWR